MTNLEIHSDFKNKSLILELKNTFVLFEDNAHFPWVILVYKRNIKNMLSLTTKERLDLMLEIEMAEKTINEAYAPIQTNIAIFGNKTPWLHVHVIARRENDATFPKTVFEIPPIVYSENRKQDEIQKLRNILRVNYEKI
jgi:diadenosine tetraphosphate (Ap4A) HIT family hydrolase